MTISNAPPPRALVVDDDRTVAGLLTAFLGRLGIESEMAHDWPTAIKLLESAAWTLLVTDLQLQPGTPDGTHLIELARRRWPAIRTILVSGSASRDVALPMVSVADRFIPKPVPFADFANAVRELTAAD